MKKTICIGVFIFGLTLNCCAYAQTHIQISGCVDTSIVKEDGADTRFDEKNPNKIAFRGSQTLNPLYTFTFELEKEFLLPDGSYKEDNGFDGKIASRLQKRSNVEFLGAANLGFQTPVGHFRFGRVPEISVENYTLIDPFEQGASGAALAKYTLLRSEQVSKAMRFDSKNNQGFNYSFAYLLGSDKHNQQNKKKMICMMVLH